MHGTSVRHWTTHQSHKRCIEAVLLCTMHHLQQYAMRWAAFQKMAAAGGGMNPMLSGMMGGMGGMMGGGDMSGGGAAGGASSEGIYYKTRICNK